MVINVNLKKLKFLSVPGIFLISFFAHSLYKWLPNPIFSIFFPVNESIWEHMKIISSSILLFGIFEYCILNKLKINYYNYLLSLFLPIIIGIITYLIIYLPIYNIIGEKIFISISLLFIIIILTQVISYFILKKNNINYNIISLIGVIIIYIIFGYLTYFPPKNYIFLDKNEQKYGINTYAI